MDSSGEARHDTDEPQGSYGALWRAPVSLNFPYEADWLMDCLHVVPRLTIPGPNSSRGPNLNCEDTMADQASSLH